MGSCLILGAGPGLGFSLAKRFAREGLSIGLAARRAEALAQLQQGLEGAPSQVVPADFARPEEVTRAVDALRAGLGPVDVLIYNAAVLQRGNPSELSPSKLLADFSVNVAGALAAAHAVIPEMKARGRGSILFTGGGLALRPFPLYSSLAIGKAGIRSLAFSLAQELGRAGIHVATVTISGLIAKQSKFDPDLIADEFWKLHAQPKDAWQTEHTFL